MIIKQKNKKINKNKVKSLFSELGFKAKICFFCLITIATITFLLEMFAKKSTTECPPDKLLKRICKIPFYFTYQMVVSVIIILFTSFFKIKNKKIYSILFYAVAVNTLLTFLFYNLFLIPIFGENSKLIILLRNLKDFNSFDLDRNIWYIVDVLQHIIVPLPFFLFFFFCFPFYLSKKKDYFYTFLHPLIYLFVWFLVIVGFSGSSRFDSCKEDSKSNYSKMERIKECKQVPYPSLQCPFHGNIIFKSFSAEDEHCLYKNLFLVLARIIVLTLFFAIVFFYIFDFRKKVYQ
ncbi:hypothetical protein ['Camptotheca acuminata' phytoplasma]|uniref:hypothetical protein n=1 Tax='Camptotheca acuminata' phytoplasma TaxID=3239192 RepID=UPI00351A8103